MSRNLYGRHAFDPDIVPTPAQALARIVVIDALHNSRLGRRAHRAGRCAGGARCAHCSQPIELRARRDLISGTRRWLWMCDCVSWYSDIGPALYCTPAGGAA